MRLYLLRLPLRAPITCALLPYGIVVELYIYTF
nr:MAG TPA: hypothetical protein [Bacteriophage sp.]